MMFLFLMGGIYYDKNKWISYALNGCAFGILWSSIFYAAMQGYMKS